LRPIKYRTDADAFGDSDTGVALKHANFPATNEHAFRESKFVNIDTHSRCQRYSPANRSAS